MSKFDKIFEARENEAAGGQGNDENKTMAKKSVGKKKSAAVIKTKPLFKPEPVVQATGEIINKRGRPPAKRSDPDFVGLTTYVRRETHTRAKIALLQEGEGRELSELVQDLISGWLDLKQNSGS